MKTFCCTIQSIPGSYQSTSGTSGPWSSREPASVEEAGGGPAAARWLVCTSPLASLALVGATASPESKLVVAHFRTTPLLPPVAPGSRRSSEDSAAAPADGSSSASACRTAWATASPRGTQRASTFADASRSSSTAVVSGHRTRQVPSSSSERSSTSGRYSALYALAIHSVRGFDQTAGVGTPQ